MLANAKQLLGSLVFIALACAVALVAQEPATLPAPAAATPAMHDQALAVVWMQRSAEYRAACIQAYRTAQVTLRGAAEDRSWTACLEQRQRDCYEGLPPAVVLDVDETILDNTAFAARQILAGKGFDQAAWAAWVHEQQAPAIPGALAYVHAATQFGIRVIFITNRRCDTNDGGCTEESDTRANLVKLGFPIVEPDGEDVVLTAGEVGDKAARRAKVSEHFRIVQLVGDNLGDFAPGTDPRKAEPSPHGTASHSTAAECVQVERSRGQIVTEFADWWGERWILIPNPSYGGFESVLRGQYATLPEALRLQR